MKAKHEFKTEQEYQDYVRTFAAIAAMQGLCANGEWMKTFNEEKYLMQDTIHAEMAIKRADALMKQLFS